MARACCGGPFNCEGVLERNALALRARPGPPIASICKCSARSRLAGAWGRRPREGAAGCTPLLRAPARGMGGGGEGDHGSPAAHPVSQGPAGRRAGVRDATNAHRGVVCSPPHANVYLWCEGRLTNLWTKPPASPCHTPPALGCATRGKGNDLPGGARRPRPPTRPHTQKSPARPGLRGHHQQLGAEGATQHGASRRGRGAPCTPGHAITHTDQAAIK